MHRSGLSASVVGLLLLLGIGSTASKGQTARVTPSDCVGVRYITGVSMSPSGKRVAYIVKDPNLTTNQNDYKLFVRNLEDQTLSTGRVVLTATAISSVEWLNDDREITAIITNSRLTKRLVLLNTVTMQTEPLSGLGEVVASYSINPAGTVIAYAIEDKSEKHNSAPAITQEEVADGYLIGRGSTGAAATQAESIYVRRRASEGKWSTPSLATIENPFSHVKTTFLPFARSLSLSPNGRWLLFNYYSDCIPNEWKSDPAMKPYVNTTRFDIMVLYDLKTKSTRLAFNALYPASTPLWSADSRSFLVNSPSPGGSRWEAEDIQDHRDSPEDANLFEVALGSGKIEEVFRHVPWHHEGPLAWLPAGDVILRSNFTNVVRLRWSGSSWKEVENIDLARTKRDMFDYLVSNGREILGVHETITEPPDLFEYEPTYKKLRIITDINPQLHKVHFAPVETIQWTTRDGLSVHGLLFLPPEYHPDKRYPLVIQTKGTQGWFACDSGATSDPDLTPKFVRFGV